MQLSNAFPGETGGKKGLNNKGAPYVEGNKPETGGESRIINIKEYIDSAPVVKNTRSAVNLFLSAKYNITNFWEGVDNSNNDDSRMKFVYEKLIWVPFEGGQEIVLSILKKDYPDVAYLLEIDFNPKKDNNEIIQELNALSDNDKRKLKLASLNMSLISYKRANRLEDVG